MRQVPKIEGSEADAVAPEPISPIDMANQGKVGANLVAMLEAARTSRGMTKAAFAAFLGLHDVQYAQLVLFERAFNTLTNAQLGKIGEAVNRSKVEVLSYAGVLSITDFIRPLSHADNIDEYYDTIAQSEYVGGLLSKADWLGSPRPVKLLLLVLLQRLDERRLLQLTDAEELGTENSHERPPS